MYIKDKLKIDEIKNYLEKDINCKNVLYINDDNDVRTVFKI